MSTNWEYAPVSPQDKDFTSENQQSESTQSVNSLKDEREKSQSNQKDDLKLHKQDTSQTFTNADVGDVLQIPDWLGPQTLEVTPGKAFYIGWSYLLLDCIRIWPTALESFAIMGWCLKTYGRYRSERGVKLGELERVIGSQTVFSFLRFAFTFKQFDRLCIVLGILWVLSPLGGQAILRMLSMRQVAATSSEAINYFNLYANSSYDGEEGVSFDLSWKRNRVNALYISSLYAPAEVKNRTTDQWGGIKIPSIESLDFDRQDDDGVAVGEILSYTSLLGVPINSTAYKAASKYSFSLNTTAFSAQCEQPTTFLRAAFPGYEKVRQNIFLVTHVPGHSLMGGGDEPLVFVVHNCMITPNFLLAKVECHLGHCSMSRIKKLPDPDDQQVLTMLDSTAWDRIVKELPKSTDDPLYGMTSQTEFYLHDPQSLYPDWGSELRAFVDFREIPIADLNRRLATILNTYYQAAISPEVRLDARLNPPIDDASYPQDVIRATVATIHTLSPETYQRHWSWVIPALVASLAMLGIAITGILLEKRAIGPDIYGYVSSMTRDSPYFPLPPNG
ncbi:hypothetical protein CPB86DRAFT_801898, partial [Serendipita vermifera]